jgi:hypothetical protein
MVHMIGRVDERFLITQGGDLCIYGGSLCRVALSYGFKAGGIMLLQVRVEQCL